jgi:hypothetical protein
MILFQGIFPSAEIIINSYDWLSVVSADKSILVDSSLTVLKISIAGASALISDSVKNLTNVVIGKLGKLGHKQNCSHDFFIFFNYNIIIVQVRYITIERKDVVPYWT